jgi:hypothetical protein
MEGQGVVEMDDPKDYNGGKGNLEYVMAHSPLASKYNHLKDGDGKWAVRDDVWVRYKTPRHGMLIGGLTVGYTGYGEGSHIGPELQFGHVVGDYYDNQVLLIKTAWGGAALSLQEDNSFHPPSSDGPTGNRYTQMIEQVDEALNNLQTDFPGYDGSGYEIAGFIWFQGWNDMLQTSSINEYEENLTNLIKDIREEWNVPNLPVVIGETGNGGENVNDRMRALRAAQAATAARPEWNGTVAFVSTTEFARPANESPNTGHAHHWFGNAESYFLIGDALGKAAIKLIE